MANEDYLNELRLLMKTPERIRNICTSAHIHHGKCVAGDSRLVLADGSIKPAKALFELAEKKGVKFEEKEEHTIYDLSKEISYESDKLIDYGIYKAKDSGEISTSIISLAANYSAENPDTELTVVYGNATSINSLLFARTSTGTTSLAGAGYSQQSTNLIPVQSWQENGNVIVALDNRTTLSFALQPSGENFFIVLRKTSGGEIIVASSG